MSSHLQTSIPMSSRKFHLWTSKRTNLGELISWILPLFYPLIHVHFDHIDQDLAMFRLHFAYMSLYQVLEYHMEFLETFGCIWSSKEVFKVIIGRAVHGSNSPERHREVAVTPLSERLGQSDTPRSLAFLSSDDTKWSRRDLSERPSQVAPEAQSDLSERRAEVAPCHLFARTYDLSRVFWSFYYARFTLPKPMFKYLLYAIRCRLSFIKKKPPNPGLIQGRSRADPGKFSNSKPRFNSSEPILTTLDRT